MRLFYSIFICFYSKILYAAACYNHKARKWVQGRKNWEENLCQKLTNKESYIWIHCASAGEFEQAIPLINGIKNQESRIKTKIAVSFFSPSGFEMYQDSGLADVFFYLPLDTKRNAEKLIEILKPSFVIFVRNEIWWNLLAALKNNNIPTYLINADLNQKRNLLYQRYLNHTYPLFTKIFDTKTYGNTKLEKVISNKNEHFRDEHLDAFCRDSFIVISGSSWPTEEKYIAEFYKQHKDKIRHLKIIIVPHEYDDDKQTDLEILFGEKVISCSQYASSNVKCSLLFLDKKGILKYAYRYADIAFIGGGFNKTVHNISEAAAYGIPTIFGPNYGKFEEAKELVNLDAAFSAHDYSEFEAKLLLLIEDKELRNAVSVKLRDYFATQQNTAEKILSEIYK